MKIWIDTNVILDVLCNREGFAEASSEIWRYCEVKKVKGYISALSVPNIVYILRKELSPEKTQQIIDQIMMIFEVVDLKASDLKSAADMLVPDFEDAIQICQTNRIKADYICTRNIKDFVSSKIPAFKPSELLERI